MFLFHRVTPYIWYQIFDSSFGRFLSSAEFKVQTDPISIFYVRYHRTASSVDHYPTNRDVHCEWFAHDLCCELQPMEEHTSKYVIANHHLFTEFSPKLKEKKISVLSQLSPILDQEKLILYIQEAHTYYVLHQPCSLLFSCSFLLSLQVETLYSLAWYQIAVSGILIINHHSASGWTSGQTGFFSMKEGSV